MECPSCSGQGYRVYQGVEFPCSNCRGKGTIDNGNTNRVEAIEPTQEPRKKRKYTRKVGV